MKGTILALTLVLLAGCTTSTEYGPCVGIGDTKNPHLVYKLSAWNIGLGIVFFEVILPPVFVLVDETYCPVGKAD